MPEELPPLLITGAGGAAAVAVVNEVWPLCSELHAVDMDPCAAGLYLVPEQNRHLIPSASDPTFVDRLLNLCVLYGIEVLVPTVDAELVPIARRRADFEHIGVQVMVASSEVLETVLDKARLMEAVASEVPCPRTVVYDRGVDLSSWRWPALLKPRRGSGSRGVRVLGRPSELLNLPADGSALLQEYLPGDEYSVDVLATPSGEPLVAVPRVRLKVDSGIAVCAATVRDPELEELSKRVVGRLRLPFVCNVQWKRDVHGDPRLLEINPRFPGTMPLTVASGVNMPRLALALLLGSKVRVPEQFAPKAVVRTWKETWVPYTELAIMLERGARSTQTAEVAG
ncbi:MAG: ATP-grasp domain-containing protein [Acidobacteriota bacterium]